MNGVIPSLYENGDDELAAGQWNRNIRSAIPMISMEGLRQDILDEEGQRTSSNWLSVAISPGISSRWDFDSIMTR